MINKPVKNITDSKGCTYAKHISFKKFTLILKLYYT